MKYQMVYIFYVGRQRYKMQWSDGSNCSRHWVSAVDGRDFGIHLRRRQSLHLNWKCISTIYERCISIFDTILDYYFVRRVFNSQMYMDSQVENVVNWLSTDRTYLKWNAIQLNFMEFYTKQTFNQNQTNDECRNKNIKHWWCWWFIVFYKIECISTKQCDSRLKFIFFTFKSNTKQNKLSHKIQTDTQTNASAVNSSYIV